MPASNAIIKKPDFSQSAQSSARNKPLPQNIEAEESVLAACMLNGEAVEELILKLKPEYFFRPAHRIIFEAVCDLNIRRIPVDQISLADTLNASGQLGSRRRQGLPGGPRRQHLRAHQLAEPR